jgi:hypothetical protein
MIGFGITSQMGVLVIGESLNVKSAVKSPKNFLGSMAYNYLLRVIIRGSIY